MPLASAKEFVRSWDQAQCYPHFGKTSWKQQLDDNETLAAIYQPSRHVHRFLVASAEAGFAMRLLSPVLLLTEKI